MVIVVEAFDGRVLDCAVHPLNLPIGPRVIWLCETMFDPVGLADHVEAHGPRIDCIPVTWLLGELNAVDSENGVDLIGHSFEHMLQELPSCLPVRLLDQLGHCKFARAVDADEQV